MRKNACITVMMLAFACSAFFGNTSFALTYSDEVNVQFTFNPSVSISLSSPALVIEDLSPGNSSDSNIITVATSTNSSAGFVLTASVGDSTHLGPSYNNTNLNHSNNTNVFTSIATNSDLTSLTTDDTWGYSLSSNSGSTWSNYSGLPIYSSTPKTILETSTQGSSDIQFKIAAKASLGQASGDYTNVINFVAVATPEPEPELCNPSGTTISTIVCMQDISSSNKSSIMTSMTAETQYTLIDMRDEKTYTVAKLADGNIWMTQNLDLDLDSTKTYTNEDTDLGWNASTNSYNAASWTPNASTKPSTDTTWDSSTAGRNNIPQSYDPGDLYWSGTYYDSTPVASGSSHYHLGNYYSWTAAVAMNDTSSYTTNGTDLNQSICPSGWRLPNISDKTFYYLWDQYDFKITGTPLYFTPSSSYNSTLSNIGDAGDFWTSVVYSSTNSYEAFFYLSEDYYGDSDLNSRYWGSPVRCLAR